MTKKQTNYLKKATNRFVKELRRKGIQVQTLEPKDNGKSTKFQEKSFNKNHRKSLYCVTFPQNYLRSSFC